MIIESEYSKAGYFRGYTVDTHCRHTHAVSYARVNEWTASSRAVALRENNSSQSEGRKREKNSSENEGRREFCFVLIYPYNSTQIHKD